MVERLIEINYRKYENIIRGAEEIDIYLLDQVCADVDKTVGYIRKIKIMMSGIVEKQLKSEEEEDLMMMMMMMETKEDLMKPEEKRLIKKNGQIKKKKCQ